MNRKPALRPPLFMLLALVPGACLGPSDSDVAEASIRAVDLARITRTLAGDEFAGRGPNGPGETATLAYLTGEFERIGLRPMGDRDNGEHSWLQRVPVARITANAGTASIRIESRPGLSARHRLALEYGRDFVAWTTHEAERVELTAPLVYVGYGIVASEENWDDYGTDVNGAVVVMLVNDPPGKDRFGGNAMTYYGRWTYKFEEAARQGAVGALLIHDPRTAGYGWEVVRSSWSGPQFRLPPAPAQTEPAIVEGWVTHDAAAEVFAAAGLDLGEQIAAAGQSGFAPLDLGLEIKIHLDNDVARIESSNVVGALDGADAKDEAVIWTAHWDHLGEDPTIAGDGIYNGALDNATGVAALLEIAEAFASLDEPTRRSHLFVSTTLEEKGLLGSAYYAAHPIVDPGRTVAAINIDGLNVWGPTRDVTVIGLGNSELDDYLARALGPEGRSLTPDPEPEKGFYYRSDHFPLARIGIPALYIDAGVHFDGRPEEYGHQVRERYTREHYHRPSDEFDPAWDFRGAEADVRALFRVGLALTRGRSWPNWRADSEFLAAREASRGS